MLPCTAKKKKRKKKSPAQCCSYQKKKGMKIMANKQNKRRERGLITMNVAAG